MTTPGEDKPLSGSTREGDGSPEAGLTGSEASPEIQEKEEKLVAAPRFHFFHRWSQWYQIEADVWARDGQKHKQSEQRRICMSCGYTQDRSL